ncbi:staygreen family protein [Bacillus sinesaloumensis]|uniref:staygreen family protein n=1 Tax=Litchfieldia sinesaloumensis TaxID=1926280 RepID=UPI0009883143|nr:staygreen family protein [Bacillus sinesaloumensis]
MSKFTPEKLTVEYFDGTTATEPLFPRRYTLTHSDETAQLFLTIGTQYAWNKINPTRDEVLGEWGVSGGYLCYSVYVYIDQGEYDPTTSAKRNEIFRRELPLALTAIRYGDRFLFNAFPFLNDSPIIIHFNSSYPQFARQENWGAFKRFAV